MFWARKGVTLANIIDSLLPNHPRESAVMEATSNVIDRIGKYFAEQEAQLRRVHAQATAAPSQPIVYRNTQQQQHQIPASQVAEPDALPDRSSAREPSLLRRHFSAQSGAPAAASEKPDAPSLLMQMAVRGAKSSPGSVVVVMPPVALSPHPHALRAGQHACSHRPEDPVWGEEEGFASWLSAQSHSEVEQTSLQKTRSSHDKGVIAKTVIANAAAKTHPEDESSGNNDGSGEAQADTNQLVSSSNRSSSVRRSSSDSLRKSVLKRSSSIRKKATKKQHDKPNQPDPEQLKRENEQKVAAALVLAQERARRIQAERELQMRNRELARRDEQRRVQEEMDKIEAMRQKSKQFALRLRPSSAPSTPNAEREPVIINSDSINSGARSAEYAVALDLGSSEEGERGESTLLDTVERQLCDRVRSDREATYSSCM